MGTHEIRSLESAGQWLNSQPLSQADLRGHVVVVDFWTLSCINWLRTVPYLRAWSEHYHDDGLVIIGAHTPEFAFEHDASLVSIAIADRGIDYPVVIDNDYTIWNGFRNNYWPALYTIDGDGDVRDYHPGEQRYAQPERVIQRLLGVDRDLVTVEGKGIEAAADWYQLRSPETYLGYARGDRLASPAGQAPDEPHHYELPRHLRSNRWALEGQWTVGLENVVLEQPAGRIAYRFHARDAHIVLSRRSQDPIAFRVLLDGESPGASHGADVDEHGNGVLDVARLYQLVRQHDDVHARTIELTFSTPGAEAYAFTFG